MTKFCIAAETAQLCWRFPYLFYLSFSSFSFPKLARPSLAGAAPNRVRTGDLNGDNKPDVVVTGGLSHVVTVLLGNGDGTVQAPRHYVAGNTPTEVSIVDHDNDGIPDLIVANVNDDHLSILPGNGDGTFKAAPTYPTVPNLLNRSGGSEAAVAEFTGDTIPDVVILNDSSTMLLPGLGAGALGPAATLAGLDGTRVVAGDWNSDNKQDLAFTRLDPARLSIALGNDDGTFGAAVNTALPGSDNFADFIVAAFVNADAIPDLLVANSGDGSVSVFLGDGSGGFNAQPTVPIGTLPNGLATGDLNGDGKLDLAVANLGGFIGLNGSIKVALGNGDGTFKAPKVVRASVQADSVVIADFDGDGKADLAAVVEDPEFDWEIEIFRGKGNGTFFAPLRLGVTQDLVNSLRVADFDTTDGTLDGIPAAPELQGKSFTIEISDQDGSTVKRKFTIKITKALTITTSSLPAGTQGKNYKKKLLASGGKTPRTWSEESGNLPSELNLDPLTGKITGTPLPSSAGTHNLTLKVVDDLGGEDQKNLSLTIN